MERKHLGRGSLHADPPKDYWLERALSGRVKGRLGQSDATPGYRREIRKNLPLEVLVNYGMTQSGAWRVRDLSVGGAFVEMSTDDLSPGISVELVLWFSRQQRSVEHRLPAKVVRIGPDGVALQFGAYDDEAYTDLVNLLHATE